MRNAPISQVDVEERLLQYVEELEKETELFEQLAIDDAQRGAEYKKLWAGEYLSAKGSIPEREAWANYKLDDANYAARVAEALVKAKREKLFALRTGIEALRTISANVRSQT